ncbi:MAG: HAMP domain-containing histidine kinase [Clostridia bacterium]|nr:HAMP domain-containing histidine kinase [Clostridia bacterium]
MKETIKTVKARIISFVGTGSNKHVPLRIALIYSIVGGAWVLFSDKLIAGDAADVSTILKLQTFKGWFYVAGTAIMVFFLVKKGTLAIQQSNKDNERLLKEAIEYDRLKTELFTNISHEFRTPLNVILGTIQLLEAYEKKCTVNTECQIKREKHLKAIRQNSYRLLRLINNLIDITKIDSGYMNIKMENKNIVDIVESVSMSVEEYIRNKSIKFTFDTEVEDKVIACDVEKIERIVLNLLSNAVKNTRPGGEIWVKISDKGKFVLLSIKDSGIGIPEEKKKIIFERFRQVNSSLTRENEGSGIGLSIVESLVKMHGGRIWVESETGKGSEFLIELPVILVDNSNDENNESALGMEKVKIEFSDIYLNE